MLDPNSRLGASDRGAVLQEWLAWAKFGFYPSSSTLVLPRADGGDVKRTQKEDRMTIPRAMSAVFAGAVMLAKASASAAESPAELISSYRLKHGEISVTRDGALDRIAQDQALAMAAKDDLSQDALGSFFNRIAPAHAGRAAENIAYGYQSFEKTLGQWIDSSGHRKNLLLHNATKVGVASATDATGKRTYWAMVIAGDYEKPSKGKGEKNAAVAAKQTTMPSSRTKSNSCRVKFLGLCMQR